MKEVIVSIAAAFGVVIFAAAVLKLCDVMEKRFHQRTVNQYFPRYDIGGFICERDKLRRELAGKVAKGNLTLEEAQQTLRVRDLQEGKANEDRKAMGDRFRSAMERLK